MIRVRGRGLSPTLIPSVVYCSPRTSRRVTRSPRFQGNVSAPLKPISTPTPRVRILLSGGMDSAACLAFYRKQQFSIRCFHVSFGQAAEAAELAAAERLADYYGTPLSVLRWAGLPVSESGERIGRNAFLYLAVLLELGARTELLASGIHAGTTYYDCSRNFLSTLQVLFDGYCDGSVRAAAPFIEWTKGEVFAFCNSARVPLNLTYSCENGTIPSCGSCSSCQERKALYAL